MQEYGNQFLTDAALWQIIMENSMPLSLVNEWKALCQTHGSWGNRVELEPWRPTCKMKGPLLTSKLLACAMREERCPVHMHKKFRVAAQQLVSQGEQVSASESPVGCRPSPTLWGKSWSLTVPDQEGHMPKESWCEPGGGRCWLSE